MPNDDKIFAIKIDCTNRAKINSYLGLGEREKDFIYSAIREKITRMESRNDRARKELFIKDVKIFTPIIKDILTKEGLI